MINVLYSALTYNCPLQRTLYCTPVVVPSTAANIIDIMLATKVHKLRLLIARLLCILVTTSPYYSQILDKDPDNSYRDVPFSSLPLPPYTTLEQALHIIPLHTLYTLGNYVLLLTIICISVLNMIGDSNAA